MDDAHRCSLEVLLGHRCNGGLGRHVASGDEQCVSGVIGGQNRQNPDDWNLGCCVRLVVRKEVESEENEFDVLTDEFLGACL